MSGFKLDAVTEWVAHDPFGKIKPTDESEFPVSIVSGGGAAMVQAARGGYASFRLLVAGAGEYKVRASAGGGLAVDLYKAWYHHLKVEGQEPAYWPDALVPVKSRQTFALPDPDNKVPGQTVQEFWVDIYVPADAKPGRRKGKVQVLAGAETVSLPVQIEVLEPVIPEESCIQMDHNSYGSRGFERSYPKAFARAKKAPKYWHQQIEILHHRYRLFREHRVLYHNLSYGHSGSTDPIYHPEKTGSGRELQLSNWDLYDRHYGPLLDGSAFATAAPGMPGPRRPAAPIWGIYTPMNPEWPADYVNWGEPGYREEFTRGVGQFDAHFREKGWTNSVVEFFFNHKKRYRWFEWDGDEPKYSKDDAYHLVMGKLLREAIGDTPVNWRYRMDASWQQKSEWQSLAGSTDFWVCGQFIRWYRQELAAVLERGDIVWWYGGHPPIQAATGAQLENVYKTWVRGVHGFTHWSSTSPGRDPWFDSNGSSTGVVYPGERFGIAGPIPSVRLKIERNGVQDIDLIDGAARAAGTVEAVRETLLGTVPVKGVWEKPPRVARELPPEDWDSVNLQAEHEPIMEGGGKQDPQWWRELRRRALEGEVR